MESFMRNFLWSSAPIKLKRNQIKWEVVCLPTQEGGLGIRRVHEQNAASFTKLAWTVDSSNSLWANWMSYRYLKGSTLWTTSSPISGSFIWRRIRSATQQIHPGSKWIIGDGKSADVWFDSWAMDQPLASLLHFLSLPTNQHLSTFWNGSSWDLPTNTPVAAEIALRNVVQHISIDDSSAD
ncbi:hypothetical protein AAC387_Pa09g0714 [Persea americana]